MNIVYRIALLTSKMGFVTLLVAHHKVIGGLHITVAKSNCLYSICSHTSISICPAAGDDRQNYCGR